MGRTCSLVSIKGRGRSPGPCQSPRRPANQEAPTPLRPRPLPYKVAKNLKWKAPPSGLEVPARALNRVSLPASHSQSSPGVPSFPHRDLERLRLLALNRNDHHIRISRIFQETLSSSPIPLSLNIATTQNILRSGENSHPPGPSWTHSAFSNTHSAPGVALDLFVLLRGFFLGREGEFKIRLNPLYLGEQNFTPLLLSPLYEPVRKSTLFPESPISFEQ